MSEILFTDVGITSCIICTKVEKGYLVETPLFEGAICNSCLITILYDKFKEVYPDI